MVSELFVEDTWGIVETDLKEVQELVALFDYKYGNQSELTFN